MTNLMASFVNEARDLVKALVDGLLALEQSPSEAKRIEECFRAMHTLKGSSGIFEVAPFTRLTHAAEDLLDSHRGSGEPLNSGEIDLLLDATDQLIEWIDAMEVDGTLPADAAEVSQAKQDRFSALISDSAKPEAPAPATAAEAASALPDGGEAAAPGWIFDALDGQDPGAIVAREPVLHAIRYQPAREAFFGGDDPVLLWKKIPDLVAWSLGQLEPWPEPDEFDPYVCNLVLTGLTTAPREDLDHLFRYVLDEVAIHRVTEEDVASLQSGTSPVGDDRAIAAEPESEEAQPGPLSADRIEILRLLLERQQRLLDGAGGDQHLDIGKRAAVQRLAGNLSHLLRNGSQVRSLLAGMDPAAADTAEQLREAISILGDLVSQRPADAAVPVTRSDPAGNEPDKTGRDPSPAIAIPSDAGGAPVEKPVAQVAQTGAEVSKAAGTKAETRAPAQKSYIRVEEARLDMMMNLIGELVVAKNALPYLATQAVELYDCPVLGRQISQQYTLVDRLAHEMQTAMLQLRMLPISEVFDRFPRLVRDVSRKLDKEVELVIKGAESEVDKTIVEALADPMIHIVRNSLDHGLEPAAERVAFGKSGKGLLLISAETEADQLIVKISDDGRGIDPDKLREKAFEKGLITAEERDGMTREEALDLIFRAGLSTKAEVSDLSGRGVGMDVAINSIQALGGRISVSSELGRGTTVRLSLPLSMAISRIVVVGIGNERFGIPMDMISQMVQIDQSEIKMVQGQETFLLRGQVVPVLRMKHLLDQDSGSAEPAEREAVIITTLGNRLFGFVVDDLHERMETIIKPMEGVVAGLPGFMGTSLMGDGSVLLVINPQELAYADAA